MKITARVWQCGYLIQEQNAGTRLFNQTDLRHAGTGNRITFAAEQLDFRPVCRDARTIHDNKRHVPAYGRLMQLPSGDLLTDTGLAQQQYRADPILHAQQLKLHAAHPGERAQHLLFGYVAARARLPGTEASDLMEQRHRDGHLPNGVTNHGGGGADSRRWANPWRGALSGA